MSDQQLSDTFDWRDRVPHDTGSIIARGGLIVGAFIGVFLVWALLFPLAAAVIGSGQIISAGSNKLVQHKSGGIVSQIFAHDGQLVTKGETLLTIDPALSKAEHTSLRARQTILLAQKARLEAEKSGAIDLAQPANQNTSQITNQATSNGLRGSLDSTGSATRALTQSTLQQNTDSTIFAEQSAEFRAGRELLASQLKAAHHQVESLQLETAGLTAQANTARQLLVSNRAELARMKPLARAGYLARRDVWALERLLGEQRAMVAKANAAVGANRENIAEAAQRVQQLISGDREEISQQLSETLSQLAAISDQLSAAEAVVAQTDIRAPSTGTLINLTAHTIGGVIAPQDPIAEIVPAGAQLIARARVQVKDVAEISLGQSGDIIVTAFNRRRYAPIEAEVIYLSADALQDEQTGEHYFEVHLRPTETPSKANGLDIIAPGMQAEVYLNGKSRTFMAYALKPLRDSFRRAFLER